MIRLSLTIIDEEILGAIEAWIDLLAAERYEDAFNLTRHREDVNWTPGLLRTLVSNYGSLEPRPDGHTFRVTRPSEMPSSDGYFFGVERYDDDPNRPPEYVGAAMYSLPLDGEWSDITAMFDLIVDDNALFLSLDDLHVL